MFVHNFNEKTGKSREKFCVLPRGNLSLIFCNFSTFSPKNCSDLGEKWGI